MCYRAAPAQTRRDAHGEIRDRDAATATGSFEAWLAEPEGTPRARDRRHPGDIRRQRGHPPQVRPLGGEGLSRASRPICSGGSSPASSSIPTCPSEFKQALDLMRRFDQDKGIADIEATIRAARARLPDGGKVGAVGYCLGGRLAFMTAARTDVDASVGYYAVGIDGLLGEKHAIARPADAPHRRRRPFRRRPTSSRRCTRASTTIPGSRSTIIPARITASPPRWARGAARTPPQLADEPHRGLLRRASRMSEPYRLRHPQHRRARGPRAEHIDVPRPGPGEVLVRHEAIGLNSSTPIIAPASTRCRCLRARQRGAGVVEAVGDGVADFSEGDRVGYFTGAARRLCDPSR